MNHNPGTRQTYDSANEIEVLVREFETCSLPPAAFDHRAHLAVAVWYLRRSTSIEEAGEQMRAGLLRFLKHLRDPAAYNETITLFWLKRLRSFLDAQGTSAPLDALANAALEHCNDPLLIFHYYSKELLTSDEAKAGSLEPDLRPLDF
ncbi:MAG TPA: hypothetical protein VM866_08205 [Pyrinomonadaceae bacterium]|jgi:hypothetical protein|nr:hypothetical protein [Pyrinomonadaceae bacterium]